MRYDIEQYRNFLVSAALLIFVALVAFVVTDLCPFSPASAMLAARRKSERRV
jgi:hypothetical protein